MKRTTLNKNEIGILQQAIFVFIVFQTSSFVFLLSRIFEISGATAFIVKRFVNTMEIFGGAATPCFFFFTSKEIRKLVSTRVSASCVTGAKMPEQTCVLDYEDGIHCFCNTDFCNAPNMFRLNMTVLPIIECKEVYEKEYRAAACNKCTWKVDYMAYDKTLAPSNAVENVQCGYSGQSGPFNLDLVSHIYDRIGLNFFNDGCYNISMNPQQYNLYCRCSTALCNNPEGSLPFPLPAPRISCYTSGFDSDVNNAKYDTPEASYYDVYAQLVKNDSYYDKDIECRGQFCFVVYSKEQDKYYKGCITANEQGDNKIKLGYMYVNDVPYYICNTNYLLHDDNGRGYVSMAQEAENVYWRCGVVGVENGKLGIQLMCNSEDRSNFWSMDIDYEAALWFEGKGHQHKTGSHHHVARKYLTLHFPLDICRKISTKQYGMTVKYVVKIMKKVGIREKRIHNFSIREKHISNLALIVEGKTIYCNKEILAMNSEVLMDLVYPDNFKGVQELKLPDDFKYDKLLRLIKLFHDDSDAIDCNNVEETLEMASNLKCATAILRCERWLSKTQLMTAKAKMKLAEKYSLVDLQNGCIEMLKTSHEVQRLFENPQDFTDSEIVELMDRVTLSIVGHSYDGFPK
ncbi:hypothetical protein L3Y34_007457 [Caenorhabditis briggsae]|uniref:BTB domain-containing protein n=1 Tax=Caenorhabditis briggsae TaxID=6238 RepID=A0AAE9CZR0_CAEBR|nr:hypothetical protein L3Y34_007457 [Caenorhabditis briggsae]